MSSLRNAFSTSSLTSSLAASTDNVDDSSANTRYIHRTKRSTRTAILQSSVRMIAPFVLKFPPTQPAPPGSPELHAPESVFDHCNVRQRQIGKVNIRLYEINARASRATRESFIPAQIHDLQPERQSTHSASSYEPTSILAQIQSHEKEHVTSRDFAANQTARKRKHIFYFAGGGWQTPAAQEHWKLAAHLAYSLTRAGHPTTVSIVSYPLAPHSPASKTLEMLELFYYEILPSTPPASIVIDGAVNGNGNGNGNGDSNGASKGMLGEDIAQLSLRQTRYTVQDEDVIFAGDSAGANVALSLVFNVLVQNPRARVPKKLLLISPAVDMRNNNPEMPALSKRDPILGKATVDQTAGAWCAGTTDPADPRVSPVLRNPTVLARRNVSVDGIIAGADVLAPDARIFRDKCRDAGVRGEWLEWDKMMHAFPLAFSYGKATVPEASMAVNWMIDRIKTV